MSKNPNEKEDHSSKAPLKPDMKAGVQPLLTARDRTIAPIMVESTGR